MNMPSVRVLSLVTAGLVFLATSSAFAGGITQKQKIDQLSLMPSGTLKVTGVKKWTNKDKCKDTSFAVLRANNKRFNKIYAMLLAAHLSESKTSLVIKGCKKVGGKTRPVIVGVNMD